MRNLSPIRLHSLPIIVLVLLLGIITTLIPHKAGAQTTCNQVIPSNTNKISYNLTINTAGMYKVWSRINSPSIAANSFLLQVDNLCPVVVGGSDILTSNTWEWVDYQDGNTSSVINVPFTVGTHTVTVIGNEPGLKLDSLFFTTDTSCKPSGLSVTCQPSITPTTIPTAIPTAKPTIKPTATPVPTAVPQPTSSPTACIDSSSAWKNQTLATQQSDFTLIYTATPNSTGTDAVTGLSQNRANGYDDLAAIARFNPAGFIDARNGSGYDAVAEIPYTPGVAYTFRMVVSPTKGSYNVYVRKPGGTEQIVGNNFLFRSEQKDTKIIANLALVSAKNSNKVCNVVLNNTPVILTPTTSSPTPPPANPGLQTIYFDNDDLTGKIVTIIDPQINSKWNGNNPVPGIDDNSFSVRWSGYITPRYSEKYTFTASVDDGASLWIDNKQIINKFTVNGKATYTGTISLTANQRYAIRMEYRQASGNSFAQLYWSSRSQKKEIVPADRLTH